MRLTRIDFPAVARFARADLPRPLDVPNLIHLRDERSYARYGVAVAPVLSAVGGRLLWMGSHELALARESQAERLLLVRYPSHRRFLALTLNPYYLLINQFRVRGVRSFEASFTHASETSGKLGSQRRLLVVHFNAPLTLSDVHEAIGSQVGSLLYASEQVATANFLRGHRPSDPNPLSYTRIACFAIGEEQRLELPSIDSAALQLYRRSDPRALIAKAR